MKPFEDIRDLDQKISMLLEVAEAARHLDRLIARHTGETARLLSIADVELAGLWRKTFGTEYLGEPDTDGAH